MSIAVNAFKTPGCLRVGLKMLNQETEELDDEIIARMNPKTGDIETVEVLFFSARLLRQDTFKLPIPADLRMIES